MNPRRTSDARPTTSPALKVCWALVLVLDVLAGLGLSKLEFGTDMDRLFASRSPHYDAYSDLRDGVGGLEVVNILIEGDDLAREGARDGLIDFTVSLQFVAGVDAVISPFSVPIPGAAGQVTTLDALPGDPSRTWPAAQEAQPLLGRTLGQDRRAALVSVTGAFDAATLAEIERHAEQTLAPAGLGYGVTGLPVILQRGTEMLGRDFLVLNLWGAVFGLSIAVIAIRGRWVAGITMLSSGTGVLWGMGVLGWLGVEINVISIALPILLLALSFADAVHMGLDFRNVLRGGSARPVRDTLKRIGPAVALTSLTTAVAFLSLTLSGSAVISGMGQGGAVAVLAAGAGVLLTSAVLAQTALERIGRARLVEGPAGATRAGFDWRFLGAFGLRNHRAISAAGLGLTLAACVAYFWAEPRFSLTENLVATDPVLVTRQEIERRFGPTSAIVIPIALNGADPVDTAREVTGALRTEFPDLAPQSIADLAEFAAAAGMSLDALPEQAPGIVRMAVPGSGGDGMIVTLLFFYRNSAETRILADRVDATVAATLGAAEARAGPATGPEVMSARVSAEMISALSLSLIASIAVVGGVISAWLGSVRAGLVALVPNLLPVALVGAGLALSGVGVGFSAGIALVLAFGIAVDDTIHVVNRFRLAGGDGEARIAGAMAEVSAPVVVTTLVLAAGLSGTFAASLPTVVEFGRLATLVFLLALVSDLVLLPALLRRLVP